MAAALVLILMVGIVLAQSSLFNRSVLPSLGGVAQVEQPANNPNAAGGSSLVNSSASGIRPADAYSAQLAILAQGARRVSGIDQVNRYALHVENLAQLGRAASVENRLPMVGEDYTNYLDHLQSLGQAAYAKQALRSTGADEYSIQLEELRRIGVQASTADHSHTTYLDYLRRLGEAAYARQAVLSTGANEYVIQVNELRRRGAAATITGFDN